MNEEAYTVPELESAYECAVQQLEQALAEHDALQSAVRTQQELYGGKSE